MNNTMILATALLCGTVCLSLLLPIRKGCGGRFTDPEQAVRWRGNFAVWVIICHFWNELLALDASGNVLVKAFAFLLGRGAGFAVIGFFFLAGYGTFLKAQREGEGYLKGYMLRKIRKLYPPFLVSNIVYAAGNQGGGV